MTRKKYEEETMDAKRLPHLNNIQRIDSCCTMEQKTHCLYEISVSSVFVPSLSDISHVHSRLYSLRSQRRPIYPCINRNTTEGSEKDDFAATRASK